MCDSHATTGHRRRHWRVWLIGFVAMIITGLVANTISVDSCTRPASARDGGKIIDTDVEQVNAKVEGRGPAVLLLHGFGAAIDWWDNIAPALASRYRVIRADLIGHGGTAAPAVGYSVTRQAQLAAALLDKLDVDHVTVVGHSMGGEVAVALAESNPERIDRLILIDSPPTADTTFTVMTKIYLMPVAGELLSHFQTDSAIRRGLAQGFAPGFVVPEKFIADLKQLTYRAFRTAHTESIVYRTTRPPYERLSAIQPTPKVLAIFGSLDAIVPPENAKFFERVPGARVAMVEGAGHSPMVEAPARTLKLIKEFLQ